MPRARRLDDVSCAICMETLFNKLDDLDEICPIATADCGHVFHEECLLKWFKIQSAQYLAQAREQYENFPPSRANSPSLSDAPAECPTCRAECYAHPETGEPAIHRLYIDLESRMDGGSSQMGSSPVRSDTWKGKGKEKEKESDLDLEALRLARRAKALGVEVGGLDAESGTEQVAGMMRKVDTLEEDMVSLKRLTGIKTYLGGLTAALNTLRSTLETNPLTATLQAELQESKRMIREQSRSIRTIPNQIADAVDAERIRGDKRVKRMFDESEVIRRELEREQVARKTERRGLEGRERAAQDKVSKMANQLSREAKARTEVQGQLDERTKQVKAYQAKTERSKELRAKIKALQDENEHLKSVVERQSTVPRTTTRQSRRSLSFDDHDSDAGDGLDEHDSSIQEIPESLYRASQDATKPHRSRQAVRRSTATADESLQVEYPSFHDDSATFDPMRPDCNLDRVASTSKALTTGRSLTARTISCNLDEPIRGKRRRTEGTRSKYFSSENDDIVVDDEEEEEDGSDRDAIIPGTSSPVHFSPPKRLKTNPFATTREASDMRKKLPTSGQDHPRRPALRNIDMSTACRPCMEDTEGLAPWDVGDWLGIKDAQGRPKKGVASGVKVKRRA